MLRIGVEAGSVEDFAELGIIREPGRVDDDVAVRGVRCKGKIRIACVKIDGLSAHEDDGPLLVAERL